MENINKDSFENELLQLKKYVENDQESEKEYREDNGEPLDDILHNVEETAKRGRPYDILSIAYIGDMYGLAEEYTQLLLLSTCAYCPDEFIRKQAKYEKYIICNTIICFSEVEPDQLVYCGNHLFLLKAYQILIEILENSVIIHKYY